MAQRGKKHKPHKKCTSPPTPSPFPAFHDKPNFHLQFTPSFVLEPPSWDDLWMIKCLCLCLCVWLADHYSSLMAVPSPPTVHVPLKTTNNSARPKVISVINIRSSLFLFAPSLFSGFSLRHDVATRHATVILHWLYVSQLDTLAQWMKGDAIDVWKPAQSTVKTYCTSKMYFPFALRARYWLPARCSDANVKWTVTAKHWLYFDRALQSIHVSYT